MHNFPFGRKSSWSLVTAFFLLAHLLIACTATEAPQTPTVVVIEVDGQTEPTRAELTVTATAPVSTPEPQSTATPTATTEPTMMPGLALTQEIQESQELERQYQRYLDFIAQQTNEEPGDFVFNPDVRFAWEVHQTEVGLVLWLKVVEGAVSYQGEQEQEAVWLVFEDEAAEEPFIVSLEEAQQVLDLAGIERQIVGLVADSATGVPVAVDANEQPLVAVDLSAVQWVINPHLIEPELPAATVGTLLTDTTDLTLDQSGVLRYLIYPNGTQSPDIAAFGPLETPFADENMSWEKIAQNLDSGATFYENMRKYTGLDVKVATRAWEEAPKGWIEVGVKYLGHYAVDFGEFGIEEYAVFQTWIEDNGQAVPLVFTMGLTHPTMLSNFYYLDDNFEVKSHSPKSAGSIVGALEGAEQYMMIRVSKGIPTDAANPLTHGLLTPDELLPDSAKTDSVDDVLGTQVISTPPVGGILVRAQQ